jgi:apolipoprotein N-acyltransferase
MLVNILMCAFLAKTFAERKVWLASCMFAAVLLVIISAKEHHSSEQPHHTVIIK